ncbi:MAG TPA: methyl-accepting chemotaxis protein [Thermoanaerobaculia bacterium]
MAQPLRETQQPPGPWAVPEPDAAADAAAAVAVEPHRPRPPKRVVRRAAGAGLQAKIVLFVVVILSGLSLLAGLASSLTLQNRLTAEAVARGEAIARGLGVSAAPLVAAGDARALAPVLGRFATLDGVAYLAVYDAAGRRLADAPAGALPADPPAAEAPAEAPGEVIAEERTLAVGGVGRRVLDVRAPLAEGSPGSVRVGLDLDAVAAVTRQATLDLLVMLAMLAAVAVLFALLFTSRIVQPLRQLVAVARRVGKGDLSLVARVRSRDEIGLLARTFNDSIVNLRGLVQTVEERDAERRRRRQLQENIREFLGVTMLIADGDLTRRGQVTEDVLGNVVDSINVAVEGIEETLLEVREAAGTVHGSAQEMIVSTDEVDAVVRHQADDARQASGQVAGVTASLRDVATSIEAAAGAARETLDSAERGRAAVADTLDSIGRIHGEAQSLALRIKSLGDRSLEISEIVDTLTSIASQTNLLALNAAIEASGAGGEGARFAVVADEVRKLAEDSAVAAKRVGQLIKTVQAEVQDAVVAMDNGTREVEVGVRVARQAGERLAEIARLSETSAALAERIAAGSREQVEGVELVAERVSSITRLAATSEEKVHSGRRVAEHLLRVSEELNQRLSRFHLGARGEDAAG